jgi:uncharacterized protein YqjF (DUF2071 family)
MAELKRSLIDGMAFQGRAAHEVKMNDDHRPWPSPTGPWIQAQTWNDLVFIHWPVAVDVMRQVVPPSLPLDTYDGKAWIGVVPFKITNFRARFLRPLPGIAAFPELNVRTYVTLEDKPGVYFFSLDAANLLAVAGARVAYHLPYFQAEMQIGRENNWIRYRSRRLRHGPAEFVGRYRPTGSASNPVRGSLDYWLTERYCLYAVDANGVVYRADINHPPWPLQPAELELATNTMTDPIGIDLPEMAPLLHFSRRQDVIVWPPVRL